MNSFQIFLFLISFLLVGCEKMSNDDGESVENSRLYYSVNQRGYSEVLMYENGIESTIHSDPEYDYWWVKVSPDHNKLLYYRSPANPAKDHDNYEEAELLISNMDGTLQKVLIPHGHYGWRAQGTCRWSMDGQSILMIAEVPVGMGYQWRMVVTDAEGKNPVIISDYWALDPNFAPDGNQIVFIGFPENELSFDLTKLELMIGDYDSNNQRLINISRLTDNKSRDHDPSFSSDGTKIVFSAGNALYSNVDIKLWNNLTSKEEILVDDMSANGGSMCWSNMDDKIFFHSLNLLQHPFVIKSVDVESGNIDVVRADPQRKFGYFHPEVF